MDLLPVTLFNTHGRRVEALQPINPPSVGIYCCGPTVYDYAHIGNFRTYVTEDVLIRMLRFSGYQVKHVMNITDVGHLTGDADEGEDKMAVAARREKKKSAEIARFYTDKFFEDAAKLNIRRPDVVCFATEHIADMIALIRRVEKNGLTYVSNGNVYFDVEKFPRYGELAKLDLDQLKAGARVDVDTNKRNPFDFVLWFTKSKFENQELLWDSPWGRGYPGWHIECSAMSMKYLGDQFDLHCGGVDHIPVHHTNEIAQSEAASGKQPWVKHWVHAEFMSINAEKMSKSKGNLFKLDDLIAKGVPAGAFRYMCLSSHYRAQLNFNWEVLDNSKNIYEKLKTAVLGLKTEAATPVSPAPDNLHLQNFSSAIRDDLNTPLALAALSGVLADKALRPAEKLGLLYTFDQVLGLDVERWQEEKVAAPAEVQKLLDDRAAARSRKDWPEADLLRQEIAKMGFSVKDSPQGQVLKSL